MNKPQIFNFRDTQVRMVEENGQPWFVLNDVVQILGLTNSRMVKERLGDDVSSTYPIPDSLGRPQETTIINEDGLYDVILESRKPEAKTFRKWVTSEVLPTIRKTGGYVANDDLFISTYLPHADVQTQSLFKATLATIRSQNEQIAEMKPKADYFNALVDRNLLTNFRDTAKEIGVKERVFIKWLLDNGYVYRDQKRKLKPHAKHNPKLFNLKEWTKGEKGDVQTLITPEGRETFRLLISGERS